MIDYSKIFSCLPGAFAILAPDKPRYTILECSDVYLKITNKDRNILGKPLFEIFPDNPDHHQQGKSLVSQALDAVIDTKQANKSAITRYDIDDGKGGFTQKYWVSENTPVFDTEGVLICIIQSALDVSELVKLGLKVHE